MELTDFDDETLTALLLTDIYNDMVSFVAKATTLLNINFVPSIPAFSKTLSLPDESRITPAHATLVNLSADREIAVDARTCFVSDSMIVGDLNQPSVRKVQTVDIIPEHLEPRDSV